jgi:hypothetical protein
MSGLTKKTVYADKVLATLLDVKEGAHVSYAELSKGLHKYIREKDLKKPLTETQSTTIAAPSAPTQPTATLQPQLSTRKCRDCSMEIPFEAIFCDLCGVRQ